MKSIQKYIIFILLSALLLSGCGGTNINTASAEGAYESADYDYAEFDSATSTGIANTTAASESRTAQTELALQTDKIIYSAYAEIETTEYDATLQKLYSLIESYDGFIESSNLSDSSYYYKSRGYSNLKNASFVIRIPSESFQDLTSTLSDLGNVPYCNISSENITAEYYDQESRLNAYKSQEARLLEMIDKAETVEDLLAIQNQLTEVQYNIDSIQSSLTNYDRKVNYSTVNLSIQEVEEYTVPEKESRTYWENMADGFIDSLESVGNFFKNAFLWFICHLPVLTIWAVIILVIVKVVKVKFKKSPDSSKKIKLFHKSKNNDNENDSTK